MDCSDWRHRALERYLTEETVYSLSGGVTAL
jgi:hypothetical protein